MPDTDRLSQAEISPRISGHADILRLTSPQEREHLQLITTSFVSALVQIRQLQPSATTIQISQPATAFGHAIIRALEDAGYGLQLVDADQGRHYLTYRKRWSETESGPLIDYQLGVGDVLLSRDFVVEDDAIYPSSLLRIDGVENIEEIKTFDEMFAEQGGQGLTFISGIETFRHPNLPVRVRTLSVNSRDRVPLKERISAERIFNKARMHFVSSKVRRIKPDLSMMQKADRTVLIFKDGQSLELGKKNKQSMRLSAAGFSPGDIMLIKACQNASTSYSNASLQRAGRVADELYELGIQESQIYIASCKVTGFYQHTRDLPTAVELIHYRAVSR